jgi:hypothetical protein
MNNYYYPLENKTIKSIYPKNIFDNINQHNTAIMHYICYRIDICNNYPYLQFILEKIPFCNNLITEEFVLPSILVNKKTITNLEEILVNKLTKQLDCDEKNIEYLGIIENNLNTNNFYALVNITNVNITNINNSGMWLSIPTEIVNNKHICNIPINNNLVELLVNNFSELTILYKKNKNKEKYPLPDILYSINDYKLCILENLLGRFKHDINNKGFYLYFYRNYNNIHRSSITKLDNIEKGINRYVYFMDNYTKINNKELNLKLLEDILSIYTTILLENIRSNDYIDYDTIIKDYDNICNLSYHKLTNNLTII